MGEVVVEPNPGPQTEYFKSDADIVVYGGGAGGGKSWAILVDPLRWIQRPGFRGVIFRRTCPQLTGQGGLWDECQEIYRACGAEMREVYLDATFPSGASIAFCHMQHEKDRISHQGLQYAYIGFDELTHFSPSQFWYLVGRMRSTCGVQPYLRATCNPEPGWVADFLEWWIDGDGFAIPERSGLLRYMVRNPDSDDIDWADSREELAEKYPDLDPDNDILSVTFIPASLEDNPALTKRDPGYRGRLKALSKIERDRLLHCNWRSAEGSQIDLEWIRKYDCNLAEYQIVWHDALVKIPISRTRRIAVIDTAGTSREKAREAKGEQQPYSVCGIFDILGSFEAYSEGIRLPLQSLVFVRYVWRKQVDWTQLKTEVNEVLQSWDTQKCYIENAHHGQALYHEIRACQRDLIGPVIPGMGDHGEEAKLERAIASGMLAHFEQGKIFIPRQTAQNDWIHAYVKELTSWTGAPKELADQVDVTSYAVHIAKTSTSRWGGVVNNQQVTRKPVLQ